jgi:hypothetical protein
MDNGLYRYPSNMHVDERMGENRKERKKYDSDLSCIFGVVECLR